jgi:2,4-dienoyl-CoA reductase-like NADH-dependent reductase (Old Yellow Enzyme family)
MPTLFEPLTIGRLTAPNRIFMAPLTRGRATEAHVPTERMARYYAQRATAGLILTEATGISREGLGWPYAPGLWTVEQRDAWKPVTRAVHTAGGRIFAQLWHMGRLVHPDFLGGAVPVSASATTAPNTAHTYAGKQPYAEARPLDASEMPRVVADYVTAAKHAIEAGFDGVEIHAANGYLLDQFLRDGVNHRTDRYGGSVENRLRLLGEVVQGVVGEVGASRTAVRFSPNGASQGVDDSHPEVTFTEAAKLLDGFGIAFLELREQVKDGTFGKTDVPPVSPKIREVFRGPLVLNSDYTKERAEAAVARGLADAITFGRPFIANPDLPLRLARGLPLAKDDMATWYSQGDVGYVDYPAAQP